jgi:hypothetical protein
VDKPLFGGKARYGWWKMPQFALVESLWTKLSHKRF